MKKIWKIFVGVIFLAVCSGCGIKKEQKKTIEDTKEKIYRECEMLAEGYRNIYENAVKENALYELSTIQKSMDYFGKYTILKKPPNVFRQSLPTKYTMHY